MDNNKGWAEILVDKGFLVLVAFGFVAAFGGLKWLVDLTGISESTVAILLLAVFYIQMRNRIQKLESRLKALDEEAPIVPTPAER